jgi:ATP-dependent helicase/nuclease subunit A
MEQLSIDIAAALSGPGTPTATGLRLTGEQLAAVAERDRAVLLSAAAGSGKTSVLVERFVQAVCEDGIAPAAVLAITFTERAAGELRSRVRDRLLELGDREAARDTEAAFIGTFHGFCARLLRAHPLPAGLDPDFTILDAARARWLRRGAYEEALGEFVASGGDPAVDLLAAYSVDKVRAIVEQLHAELRSRGQRRPRLPLRSPAPDAGADDSDALAAVALFDQLLDLFGALYERAKEQRLAVDFDDLELIAGELLAGNEVLRASWAEGFQLLMVDEFQDTNPRQLAILRSLERENLFTVGDELQSIYGFRHADVSLFRERRAELAATGGALALTSNFRSRAEVLEAVNVIFAERFDPFSPLLHGREEEAGTGTAPAVELLLTDAADQWRGHHGAEAIAAGLPHTPVFARQAEARLLAQRVRELIDAGEARAGDVAVLLRASGDIETFERALQLEGLRTLATVGTFWERQQITDLHSYLRALANPRDDEAVYGTLASPLVGVSRDGLALLAIASSSRPEGVWETAVALAADDAEELGDADRTALAHFCGWFDAERQSAGGRGISVLLERVISHGRYLDHVRALDWPERRLANVHKLLRVARAFEAAEGRDLRAFVDHVADLRKEGAIEPEAPVEDVEPDTVRLMTIHAAKGLEFPVVCVADLGRKRPSPDDRLFVDGERLGLRLWRPGQGEGIKTLEFDQLRAERQAREREEESRVFYVAMTRARERLLLSGAVDFGSWPKETGTSPPIAWIGPALYPPLSELVKGGGGVKVVAAGEDGGGGPLVRIVLSDPAVYGTILRAPRVRQDGAVAGQESADNLAQAPSPAARAARPATVAAAPAPAPALPPTLSYTSLSLLERCGYRYYLERVLRMPEVHAASGPGAGDGLEARARGILVHRLLETYDFAAPGTPSEALVGEAAAALGLETDRGEREQIAVLIGQALESTLAQRIAAAPRRRLEHPFAFSIAEDAPLVTGVIDALCEESDGTVLVVDYKSDRLEPGAEVERLVTRDYEVQRLLYALAVLREGALVVEVAHWFLEQPEEPAVAHYTIAERITLEEQLARRLADASTDPFAVSPRPHRGLCQTCPGRGGMCSWSEQETMRENPDSGR